MRFKEPSLQNTVPEGIDLLGMTEETLSLFSPETSGKIRYHPDVDGG